MVSRCCLPASADRWGAARRWPAAWPPVAASAPRQWSAVVLGRSRGPGTAHGDRRNRAAGRERRLAPRRTTEWGIGGGGARRQAGSRQGRTEGQGDGGARLGPAAGDGMNGRKFYWFWASTFVGFLC